MHLALIFVIAIGLCIWGQQSPISFFKAIWYGILAVIGLFALSAAAMFIHVEGSKQHEVQIEKPFVPDFPD